MHAAPPSLRHTYFGLRLDYLGLPLLFSQLLASFLIEKYLGLAFPQHVTLYLVLRHVCPLL